MPIDRNNFESVEFADLQELVDNSIRESLYLEYKTKMYENTDEDRLEFLKDVSAFANTFGGHLVIGIGENKGSASKVLGVLDNPDKKIQWIERFVRDHIKPTIQGLKVRPIPIESDKYCFVLRIPPSWNRPHRIEFNNANRFWIRNSIGVYEATMEELHTLFSRSVDALDRATEVRNARLNHYTFEGREGAELVLHIVPMNLVPIPIQIDLAKAKEISNEFRPINFPEGPATSRFNFHGLLIERNGNSNAGYTQIFRDGLLEARHFGITKKKTDSFVDYIDGKEFEGWIRDRLFSYIEGLRHLDIPAPLAVFVMLQGHPKGTEYRVTSNSEHNFPSIKVNPAFLPACVIQEYDSREKYHQRIKPAIDVLWNSAGYASAESISASGEWK